MIAELLSKEDVSKILRLTVRTVERLMARGKLRKVPNLGRTVRFRPVDIERFCDPTPKDSWR
jgi:excisionase family DNA binding protein